MNKLLTSMRYSLLVALVAACFATSLLPADTTADLSMLQGANRGATADLPHSPELGPSNASLVAPSTRPPASNYQEAEERLLSAFIFHVRAGDDSEAAALFRTVSERLEEIIAEKSSNERSVIASLLIRMIATEVHTATVPLPQTNDRIERLLLTTAATLAADPSLDVAGYVAPAHKRSVVMEKRLSECYREWVSGGSTVSPELVAVYLDLLLSSGVDDSTREQVLEGTAFLFQHRRQLVAGSPALLASLDSRATSLLEDLVHRDLEGEHVSEHHLSLLALAAPRHPDELPLMLTFLADRSWRSSSRSAILDAIAQSDPEQLDRDAVVDVARALLADELLDQQVLGLRLAGAAGLVEAPELPIIEVLDDILRIQDPKVVGTPPGVLAFIEEHRLTRYNPDLEHRISTTTSQTQFRALVEWMRHRPGGTEKLIDQLPHIEDERCRAIVITRVLGQRARRDYDAVDKLYQIATDPEETELIRKAAWRSYRDSLSNRQDIMVDLKRIPHAPPDITISGGRRDGLRSPVP